MLDLLTRQLKEQILAPFVMLFRNVHPNVLTLFSLVLGVLCALFAAMNFMGVAVALWLLNRSFDGLDGVVARKFNKTSDFGGYLDIICDFTVYALIPIGIVVANPSNTKFIILALLEGTYFVNAGGLFYLSAILEKAQAGAKQNKELTSVTFPSALIEGTETVVFYSLFLLAPQFVEMLFSTFAIGVTVTILQRLFWAYQHLSKPAKA